MTVLEHVLLARFSGAQVGYLPRSDAKKEALAILEFVGLSATKATPANDLTLAKQKRVGSSESISHPTGAIVAG